MGMNNKHLLELQKQGYRLTAVRVFIIDFLTTHTRPFDVATIQTKLEQAVKKVNKTTLYREIEFLLSKHILQPINFGDGKTRYEIAGLPHHHHLVCKACHKIEDVFLDNELATIEHKIKKTTKFTINSHTLEFFGVCRQCTTN